MPTDPKNHKATPNQLDQASILQLTDEIAELEAELTQVASEMEIKGLTEAEIAHLQARYEDITIALDALLIQWQQLTEV